MVINNEEYYTDMVDSLKAIFDDALDEVTFDIKLLKKELKSNYRKDDLLLRSFALRDDIRNAIESLQEISSLMDELDGDIEDYDEKKREEYTAAFHRMFSLP